MTSQYLLRNRGMPTQRNNRGYPTQCSVILVRHSSETTAGYPTQWRNAIRGLPLEAAAPEQDPGQFQASLMADCAAGAAATGADYLAAAGIVFVGGRRVVLFFFTLFTATCVITCVAVACWARLYYQSKD